MSLIGSLLYWFIISKLFKRINYKKYLKSRAWQFRRRVKLFFAGYKCELCKSEDRLDCHHLTYKRLGREKFQDLKIVCRPCHQKIHGRIF